MSKELTISPEIREFIIQASVGSLKLTTVGSIKAQLYSTFGIQVRYSSLKEVMVKHLGLSYKKCSSRPILYSPHKTTKMKILFSIKLCKILKETSLLVNIDEASIGNSTKINYTWLWKGKDGFAKNKKIKGSIGLISSITSDGCNFTSLKTKTVNSEVFINYLRRLIGHLVGIHKYNESKICILLDISPIHRAKKVLNYFNSTKLKVVFIPSYSPEVAPIEIWFCIIKRRFCSIESQEVIKLPNDGAAQITKIIVNQNKEEVKRIWSSYYRTICSLLKQTLYIEHI